MLAAADAELDKKAKETAQNMTPEQLDQIQKTYYEQEKAKESPPQQSAQQGMGVLQQLMQGLQSGEVSQEQVFGAINQLAQTQVAIPGSQKGIIDAFKTGGFGPHTRKLGIDESTTMIKKLLETSKIIGEEGRAGDKHSLEKQKLEKDIKKLDAELYKKTKEGWQKELDRKIIEKREESKAAAEGKNLAKDEIMVGAVLGEVGVIFNESMEIRQELQQKYPQINEPSFLGATDAKRAEIVNKIARTEPRLAALIDSRAAVALNLATKIQGARPNEGDRVSIEKILADPLGGASMKDIYSAKLLANRMAVSAKTVESQEALKFFRETIAQREQEVKERQSVVKQQKVQPITQGIFDDLL
jgi:hypothetical protein